MILCINTFIWSSYRLSNNFRIYHSHFVVRISLPTSPSYSMDYSGFVYSESSYFLNFVNCRNSLKCASKGVLSPIKSNPLNFRLHMFLGRHRWFSPWLYPKSFLLVLLYWLLSRNFIDSGQDNCY